MIPFPAMSPELKLAEEFVAEHPDTRLPWASEFATWAKARNLDDELMQSTRKAILALRIRAVTSRRGLR